MRDALRAALLSLRELGEEAGVTRVTLSRYLAGEQTPSPETARRIAKVLRKRGKRLAKLADELERAAKKGGKR